MSKKVNLFKKILVSGIAITLGITTALPAHGIGTAIPDEITATYPYYGFVENPEDPWDSVYDALDETGTIKYSDRYFDVPSPGDHPELRAVSYALGLAGYENTADGYPSTSATPNPKLTNFLDQLGFSDYQNWDASSETDGHSFGTTIGRKTLPSGQDLIVIAPRNYNYLTEWLSNLNVGTSGDHAGFSEAANLVVDRFNQYLASRNLANYKVWVVGYSRGGAVVDLFAKKINASIDNYQMTSNNFYVYTFGAPRASITDPQYSNIHDVKDGNDLMLGYVFPEAWGFYNTGVYEEIHPADLEITTAMVDISTLVDSSTALNILSSNEGLVKDVATTNGKDFMDSWMQFVTENGLTRVYFDTEVKPPLSALLKIYQSRTIDKQSDLLDFIKNTDSGIAAMVAGNAFADILSGTYPGSTLAEILDNFPPYQDIVKVLKGTATDADVDELLTFLTRYIGEYDDYEDKLNVTPPVTETEFSIIKENLPKLVKALSPIIIADAKYTQETYGENYSLFYTYSLVSNARQLVIGHIPESLMPILKSLITEIEDDIIIPKVPNTGRL